MSETIPADAVAIVESVTTIETVHVKLSDHELAEKAMRLSAIGMERCSVDAELESAKAKAKARMKEMDEEQQNILTVIRHGEERKVECRTLFNVPRPGRATCRRSDTLESFERDMSKEEIQPRLQLESPKGETPAAETPAADAPAAESPAADAPAESPAAETPAADAPAAESQAADAPAEDLEVLCDNCGHYFPATGRVTDFPHLDCPKCDKGNLEPDQVKGRDFAEAWKVRFKEAGWANPGEPHRGSDEQETYDHLYRHDHSPTAFCGYMPTSEHESKYPRKPGFPPDHFACPLCISQGHRVIDKIIESHATKPAKLKKAKAGKAEKASGMRTCEVCTCIHQEPECPVCAERKTPATESTETQEG